MKIPADEAEDALRYQVAAAAAARSIFLAKEAIDERCQIGGDLHACQLALRRMDEVTEHSAEQLGSLPVPKSMTAVHEEFTSGVDLFRRAALADLRGRETNDQALLEQAEALTRLGLNGFDRAAKMLADLLS